MMPKSVFRIAFQISIVMTPGNMNGMINRTR